MSSAGRTKQYERMRPISDRVKKDIRLNPILYGRCARRVLLDDHICQGRITFEHALEYGGSQIDEVFAIVPLCAYAHSVDEFQDGGIMNKEINQWVAINRMSEADRLKYPRAPWGQKRLYLNRKYGHPDIKKLNELSTFGA